MSGYSFFAWIFQGFFSESQVLNKKLPDDNYFIQNEDWEKMKSFQWKIYDIEQQNMSFDDFLNDNLRARQQEQEKKRTR